MAKLGIEINYFFLLFIALNQKQTLCWVCPVDREEDTFDVAMYSFEGDFFSRTVKAIFNNKLDTRQKEF